jgi:hypothetical protein
MDLTSGGGNGAARRGGGSGWRAKGENDGV